MRVRFYTPEERWERIIGGLLAVAGLFGVFTVYGITSGDDWRGVLMTAVPGVLCLGLWYTARVRLDHMASETPSPAWVKLVGWSFAAGGLATIAWMIIGQMTGHLEYVEIKDPNDPMVRREQEQEMLRRFSERTEIVRLPDGSTKLRRKQPCLATETALVDPDDPENVECVTLPAALSDPPSR